MDIKGKFTKVAVASLTVGVLAIAGLGTAATAFADGDGDGVPDSPSGDGGLVAGGVANRPQIVYVYIAPDPTPVVPVDPYYTGYPVYPVAPVYPTYPTYSYPTNQTQGLFVTGTAEVMGIDVNSVLLQLSQGRTLTQLAADRGWTRDYFLSLLVTRVQSDLIYGINAGTIDPATGNALLGNLISQASVAIDQVGVQSYSTPSIYGVFPVAPY